MYLIRNLCHRTDISMGVHGFGIDLSPEFRDAVSKSRLSQDDIDGLLATMGREWLDATGYTQVFDPDDDREPSARFEHDPKWKPGPRARPLYEPRNSLRVQWGEWGPEHISVPGNACGLDIDQSFGSPIHGARSLTPHNIDALCQKYLLLIVFTSIAEHVAYASWSAKNSK